MLDSRILCGVILALVLIVLYAHHESFKTKREKAESIYQWMKSTASPSYVKYKSYTGGASNIVEYTDVMNLFKRRNFTIDDVEAVI